MSSTSSGDDKSNCETCFGELGKNPVIWSNGWKIWSECTKGYIKSDLLIFDNFDKIKWSMKWGGVLREKDVKNNMTDEQKDDI